MPTSRTDTIKNPVFDSASVSYTGTAGDISQVVYGTCIYFYTTTDAVVRVGATATATKGTPVPAYTPMFLPIPQNQPSSSGMNQGEKPSVLISAIQQSAGGTLFMQQFD